MFNNLEIYNESQSFRYLKLKSTNFDSVSSIKTTGKAQL